jgi:hypothetical protein
LESHKSIIIFSNPFYDVKKYLFLPERKSVSGHGFFFLRGFLPFEVMWEWTLKEIYLVTRFVCRLKKVWSWNVYSVVSWQNLRISVRQRKCFYPFTINCCWVYLPIWTNPSQPFYSEVLWTFFKGNLTFANLNYHSLQLKYGH